MIVLIKFLQNMSSMKAQISVLPQLTFIINVDNFKASFSVHLNL